MFYVLVIHNSPGYLRLFGNNVCEGMNICCLEGLVILHSFVLQLYRVEQMWFTHRSSLVHSRVLRLREDGLLDKWKKTYWPKKKSCDFQSSVRPVTINDLQGIYYVMSTCIALALIALVTERAVHFIQKTFLKLSVTPNKLANTSPRTWSAEAWSQQGLEWMNLSFRSCGIAKRRSGGEDCLFELILHC